MQNPLVVDLDGTLLKSDILFLSFVSFLKRNFFHLFLPFLWLFRGKAYLKSMLAQQTAIDVEVLPYDRRVLDLLVAEKARNRQIVLATATHISCADRIASHLGIFDRVIATDGSTNLSSENKRDALVAEFGQKGFDYIGNSRDDLVVWASAERSYLVNPEWGVERRARKIGTIEEVIVSKKRTINAWLESLRPHQWLKNLLVFIPLVAAHSVTDFHLLGLAALAFLLFSLCASSVYLLNDIVDLEDDRHHPRKKYRPLASGDLSMKTGLTTAGLFLAASFAGSVLFMPMLFTAALGVYYLLTFAYSFCLKRMMTVDVIALAALYTMRIIAGSFACGLVPTFWILAFSMFLFLSLALVKRFSELYEARERGMTDKAKGRGYFPGDLGIVSSLGTSSGYLSVMVLALYIQDARTLSLYSQPEIIWLACPLLLFWISRVWILTHRGHMQDDPVLFAIKDRISLLIGVLFGTVFVLAV